MKLQTSEPFEKKKCRVKLSSIYLFGLKKATIFMLEIALFLIQKQEKSEGLTFKCADHVILTGHQMTTLVLNFEYLLLLCFLPAEAKF